MSDFLIADDSPHKILLMQTMLRHATWQGTIHIAHTTDDAKKLIDAEDIGFAFIDYYFPTDNGPAVIRHLKEKHPAARIALVSSADKRENFDNAVLAGAEACICTSYPADEVERAFADILADWLS